MLYCSQRQSYLKRTRAHKRFSVPVHFDQYLTQPCYSNSTSKLLQHANISFCWVETYTNVQRTFMVWQLRPYAKENVARSSRWDRILNGKGTHCLNTIQNVHAQLHIILSDRVTDDVGHPLAATCAATSTQ